MGATFTAENVKMIPFAEEEAAIIRAEVETMLSYRYFIIARTNTGAHFESEYIDWDDVDYYLRSYCSMVDYFGGGNVMVYEEILGGYEIVTTVKVI